MFDVVHVTLNSTVYSHTWTHRSVFVETSSVSDWHISVPQLVNRGESTPILLQMLWIDASDFDRFYARATEFSQYWNRVVEIAFFFSLQVNVTKSTLVFRITIDHYRVNWEPFHLEFVKRHNQCHVKGQQFDLFDGEDGNWSRGQWLHLKKILVALTLIIECTMVSTLILSRLILTPFSPQILIRSLRQLRSRLLTEMGMNIFANDKMEIKIANGNFVTIRGNVPISYQFECSNRHWRCLHWMDCVLCAYSNIVNALT